MTLSAEYEVAPSASTQDIRALFDGPMRARFDELKRAGIHDLGAARTVVYEAEQRNSRPAAAAPAKPKAKLAEWVKNGLAKQVECKCGAMNIPGDDEKCHECGAPVVDKKDDDSEEGEAKAKSKPAAKAEPTELQAKAAELAIVAQVTKAVAEHHVGKASEQAKLNREFGIATPPNAASVSIAANVQTLGEAPRANPVTGGPLSSAQLDDAFRTPGAPAVGVRLVGGNRQQFGV